MFGIDVEKILILGTVALIVLGPERLPGVARTLGALFGRAQRYMAEVKAEVAREIQLDELKRMRTTVETAAADVHKSIYENIHAAKSEVESALGSRGPMTPAAPAAAPAPTVPLTPEKRNRFRRNRMSRVSATPIWYRQANRRKTRVISAAARVARYRVRPAGR